MKPPAPAQLPRLVWERLPCVGEHPAHGVTCEYFAWYGPFLWSHMSLGIISGLVLV